MNSIEQVVQEVADSITRLMGLVPAVRSLTAEKFSPTKPAVIPGLAVLRSPAALGKSTLMPTTTPARGDARPTAPAPVEGILPRGERRVLEALIAFPDGMRREQLTVFTMFRRSTRDTYIQRLREKGLVDVSGELVRATAAGVAAVPDARPLPAGEDLQRHWLNKLPEGERRIFEIMLAHYPQTVSREAITEQTGYARSTRDTYLQRMSAKMIFTEPSRGHVRASDNLFTV